MPHGRRPTSAVAGIDWAAEHHDQVAVARERFAYTGRSDRLDAFVLGLVGAPTGLVAQIAPLNGEISGAVRAHPVGEIFLGPFVDPKSTTTAPTLLAEMGDVRVRCPARETLCSDAGMSPVAIEPGKRRTAVVRRACDHRLRAAVGVLAGATHHGNLQGLLTAGSPRRASHAPSARRRARRSRAVAAPRWASSAARPRRESGAVARTSGTAREMRSL